LYLLLDYHSHHSGKLSAGAITGITVGGVLSFLVLSTSLIVVCICVRRYRKKRRSAKYVLLQNQHPWILEADSSNDNVSDSEVHVPAQPTTVKYNKFTDECSVETTPTNSSDTQPSPDNTTTTTTVSTIK